MDFEAIKKAAEGYRADMTRFLRDLVAIPSESCGEEGVIRRIAAEMEKLGFDKVEIDGEGNVLGLSLIHISKYLATLSPDLVTRKAPLSLRKRMARTLSSLVMRATGLPTRATDWAMRSSRRLEILTIFSGSVWGGPWTEMSSLTAFSTIRSLEMS